MTEKFNDLVDRMEELEKRVDQLEDSLNKDYDSVRLIDQDKGIVHPAGREVLREIKKKAKGEALNSNEFESILRRNGGDPHRRTVIRKMKRFSDFYEWIEFREGSGTRPTELYDRR